LFERKGPKGLSFFISCLIFLNFENKRKLLKAFEIILKIKYNKTKKSIGE